MTAYATHVLSKRPEGVTRVLHLYGPRAVRELDHAHVCTLLVTVHGVKHHWRPWRACPVLVESDARALPLPARSSADKARYLAVCAAVALIFGVVIYHAA